LKSTTRPSYDREAGDNVSTLLGRVLVIDDDAEIVATLTTALEEGGYAAMTALHGGDGLMLSESERPDAVLLDINMPGMSGIEVLQQLRLRWPDLPVIMISGNTSPELARRCIQRGAFDYIPKPFQLEHLYRCVAAALAYPRRG
jgi:DNA-binding response OmpR family regulator